MKFAICVVLSCLLASCVYSLPQSIVTTSWGNVDGNSSSIVKAFVESSLFEVKNYTVNFPDPEVCKPHLITGVKHIDYEPHHVEIHFVDGGVGHDYANIEIKSQRGHGINSTFVFYTEANTNQFY